MNDSEKFGRMMAKMFWFVISGCAMAIIMAFTIKLISWIF